MKRLICLLIISVLLFSLTACANTTSPSTDGPVGAENTSNERPTYLDFGANTTQPENEENIEEDYKHRYDELNPNLRYEEPEVKENQSIIWTDRGKRALISFSKPIGNEFHYLCARDVKNGYLFGDSGFLDSNKNLLVTAFSDSYMASFTYFISPDEYYQITIDTSLSSVEGKDLLAEKGDWSIWKETNRFSSSSASVTALLPFENPEEGGTLIVEMVGKGENADPVKAFGEAFRVDILHNNDDRDNLDVSYTFLGKRVDTSKCLSQYDITASALAAYGLTIPAEKDCDDVFIGLGYIQAEFNDKTYYVNFETEENDRYMLDPLVSGTLASGERYCVRDITDIIFIVESNRDIYVPDGYEQQTKAKIYWYIRDDSDAENAETYAKQVMADFGLS